MRRFIAGFLSFLMVLGAQQVGTNTNPNVAPGGPLVSVGTQLVVETVSVKDKNGKSVEGLKQEDFTVTEDGVPQTIKFFEFQKLDDTPVQVNLQARGADAEKSKAADQQPEKPKVESLSPNQISPETPGKTRYRDRRLIGLYFDMTRMPVPDQLRALDAAQKFVTTNMSGPDLMAIMDYEGAGVKVLQDFTDDREVLLKTINDLAVGTGQGFDLGDTSAAAADTGAAFGQNDAEFNIFYTDRQLDALMTAIKMLGGLNEQKSLVYFASGLTLNGTDNQAQMHATVNAAVRADVHLYPVDSRGLVASAPLGDPTRGAPGGSSIYTGGAAMAAMTNFQKSQDTMYSLAADTGGKALLDNNDLGKGIQLAEQGISSYYIIAYYTSNTKLDGKFRRVKISLNNGNGANLEYRQGYYANSTWDHFTNADKERQLLEALMQEDPITELDIQMEIDWFQLNTAEYYVPIMVKIPGSELVLARKKGAEHTLIDFTWEVKDDYGTTETNNRDHMDIPLSDKTVAELAKRPIEYASGFTLLPGKHKIKFLARDAETGRIGTYLRDFEIPNMKKVDTLTSTVVLSSQRVELRDALFSANKDKGKSEQVDPLVVDGVKLIPSVTRVFSKSKDMYVYLQAYEHDATTQHPLVAYVTFYKGENKAFETPPMAVTEGMNPKYPHDIPLRFDLSLAKLAAGQYNCQVTVLDPTTKRAAFWQAQVMLVP